MPITPTYPGVYIQEIPSGVRTIVGVPTSIAAFVDFFRRGPMNQATDILGWAEFERTFGGLDRRSEASYAIQQFFLNGGTEVYVVRVASNDPSDATNTPRAASLRIGSSIGGVLALTVNAISPGTWGNMMRVRIDTVRPASDPTPSFNLTAARFENINGQLLPAQSETFRNLSMNSADPNFADAVIKAGSELVSVQASGSAMPLQNGTVSDTIGSSLTFTTGSALPAVRVTIGSVSQDATFASKPVGTVQLVDAANMLEAAIRAANPSNPAFALVTVSVFDNRLRVVAGPGAPTARIIFAAAATDPTTVIDLKLTGMAVVNNSQEYTLGEGVVASTAQLAVPAPGAEGKDGVPPNATDLIGNPTAIPPTGIYALEKADLFNILCLPRIARVTGSNAFSSAQVDTVLSAATTYCEQRRAFLILDTPSDVTTIPQIKTWLAGRTRHRNLAVYFPRVQYPDPLNNFRLTSFGASGTMAGVYARTDVARGVWKAPAGTEAVLRGVKSFDYKMTNAENGTINPLAINALRMFDVYGNVAWGARTLDGSDQQASDWKYVPVRRLALMIEESLYRDTKWAVFEPNDEPLWAQLRLNVGAFMHNLFRQGAFKGSTPREAYLVKCDKETTPQNDIDLGIVNILVGFAPLKPAEFVIITIQQLAGQIQT